MKKWEIRSDQGNLALPTRLPLEELVFEKKSSASKKLYNYSNQLWVLETPKIYSLSIYADSIIYNNLFLDWMFCCSIQTNSIYSY